MGKALGNCTAAKHLISFRPACFVLQQRVCPDKDTEKTPLCVMRWLRCLLLTQQQAPGPQQNDSSAFFLSRHAAFHPFCPKEAQGICFSSAFITNTTDDGLKNKGMHESLLRVQSKIANLIPPGIQARIFKNKRQKRCQAKHFCACTHCSVRGGSEPHKTNFGHLT